MKRFQSGVGQHNRDANIGLTSITQTAQPTAKPPDPANFLQL